MYRVKSVMILAIMQIETPKSLHISISDLNTSSSSLTSPNRPPLVAVCDNIVRGGHRPNGNAGGAGSSMSSSATSSPGAQVDDEIQQMDGVRHSPIILNFSQVSVSASPSPSSGLSPRSTTVERLRKKLLRKNDKGETYLHRAAIKGSRRIAQKLLGIGIKVDDVDNAGESFFRCCSPETNIWRKKIKCIL